MMDDADVRRILEVGPEYGLTDEDRLCAKIEWQAAEIARLRLALKEIAGIENQEFGPDWEEIEQAREIATRALGE